MSAFSKILMGAASVAAVTAIAAPAAAQSYPYGGNQNGGVVGAIINSVIGGGYGQYPQGNYGYGRVDDRTAVAQCAAAAEQRLNARGQTGYGANGYPYGYGNNGYGNNGQYSNGYGNHGYANGYGQARVLGITNVERRSNGKIRVTGVASSGQNVGYQGGYGYQGRNGYQGNYGAQAQADLRFSCKVDLRGQVSDLKISRNQTAYRRGY